MSIDLQRFCANSASDSRQHLHKPWRLGNWAYAFNGHLLVRVPVAHAPDVGEPPADAKMPDVVGLFARWIDARSDLHFLLLKNLPALQRCKPCRGSGDGALDQVPDCDASEFTHGRYEYACKECEGDAAGPGRLSVGDAYESPDVQPTPCDACFGRGATDRENAPVKLGDAHYSAVYLHWLAGLPQVPCVPRGPAGDTRPAPAVFLFDGGHARC